MQKKLTKILLLSLFLPLLFTKKVNAERNFTVPEQEMKLQVKALDPRAQILRDYFARYNSPLVDHAQDFIDAADAYGVDWRLVPAITGVESTFGKATPGNVYYPSYNGWGWGVYGTQAIYFNSWREGIFAVTKGLKENYISKGLTTPYQINAVYAASPTWGAHVTYFMNDLTVFADNYQMRPSENLTVAKPETKEAVASAALSIQNSDQPTVLAQLQ